MNELITRSDSAPHPDLWTVPELNIKNSVCYWTVNWSVSYEATRGKVMFGGNLWCHRNVFSQSTWSECTVVNRVESSLDVYSSLSLTDFHKTKRRCCVSHHLFVFTELNNVINNQQMHFHPETNSRVGHVTGADWFIIVNGSDSGAVCSFVEEKLTRRQRRSLTEYFLLKQIK